MTQSKQPSWSQEFIGILKGTESHLMNGVSHMLPLVVAGGILYAIAIMLDGNIATSSASGYVPTNVFVAGLQTIGGAGLGMMVAVFAGYIAESIANRPGFGPGFLGGYLSTQVGAGFLGGIISGLFAGIVVYYLKKIPMPKSLSSVKSIILIPVIGTFLTGGLMVMVLASPLSALNTALTAWLTSMSGSAKIIMGIIVGCMISFDLGGPVNKVAFSMMAVSIAAGAYDYAAAAALAIGLPPVGAGISALLLKNKFTQAEREAAPSAIVMGLVGITEGAISYTTSDLIHMMPINMISCSVAAVASYLMGAGCAACWGGLIVLPVCTNRLAYVAAFAIGVAVYVALCAVFKKNIETEETEETDLGPVDVEIEIGL